MKLVSCESIGCEWDSTEFILIFMPTCALTSRTRSFIHRITANTQRRPIVVRPTLPPLARTPEADISDKRRIGGAGKRVLSRGL